MIRVSPRSVLVAELPCARCLEAAVRHPPRMRRTDARSGWSPARSFRGRSEHRHPRAAHRWAATVLSVDDIGVTRPVGSSSTWVRKCPHVRSARMSARAVAQRSTRHAATSGAVPLAAGTVNVGGSPKHASSRRCSNAADGGPPRPPLVSGFGRQRSLRTNMRPCWRRRANDVVLRVFAWSPMVAPRSLSRRRCTGPARTHCASMTGRRMSVRVASLRYGALRASRA